jgi:hypothetical protein
MVSINPLKQKKTMKKYIFMAVAGMLALSSCSNDDNDVQNAPRQMTFTAGFGDEAQTRATLNGSTKKVSFDANDKISIFSANNNNIQFTTTAGGASATFTGTATAGDPTYYAVYPYRASLVLEGTTVKNVRIPQNSFFSSSNWNKDAAIAYATAVGTALTFHNACALLKITNGKNSQVDITVDVAPGEALTGIFDLDLNTGELTVQEFEGSSSVSAISVPSGATIYIAIAPGTYHGLNAFWSDGNFNIGQKTKNDEFTFQKGKIYDLGNTSAWN